MKSLFVVLISLIIYSGIYAQNEEGKTEYALSFGISSNFTLQSFDMDIAGKKVYSNSNQLRLFISPQVRISDGDKDFDDAAYQSQKTSQYSIGIGADYLWQMLKTGEFQMYGGPGLKLAYSYIKGDKKEIGSNLSEFVSKGISNSSSIGMRGIIGVEWRVSKGIGIHSEYLLSFTYSHSKDEYSSSNDNVPNIGAINTSNSFYLRSSILFGLSVYL